MCDDLHPPLGGWGSIAVVCVCVGPGRLPSCAPWKVPETIASTNIDIGSCRYSRFTPLLAATVVVSDVFFVLEKSNTRPVCQSDACTSWVGVWCITTDAREKLECGSARNDGQYNYKIRLYRVRSLREA